MITYPGAVKRPSTIPHPVRGETRGIVIHWTEGHEAGNVPTLDGPVVDCHFYVTKAGRVFQFLDPSSQAWHARRTANATCLGIEHEGFGEAWTEVQLDASAKLAAWLCRMYNIPIRKVDPPGDWRGLFGHGDLVGIDGNDHTDTVPKDTGWRTYLARIRAVAAPGSEPSVLASLPHDATLRLVLQPKGKPRRSWAGWQDASGPLRWIAAKGIKPEASAALSFRGKVVRGPDEVTVRARELVAEFLKET